MRGKTITQSWETIQAQCSNTELRGLTQQHIVALLGVTPFLRWGKRYSDETNPETLDDFVNELETRLVLNMVQDGCELLDCYGNVVFDFATCMRDFGLGESISDSIDNSITNYNTYNGDVTNINEGYSDPANPALCYIITTLVDLVCKAVIATITQEFEEDVELAGSIMDELGQVTSQLGSAVMAAGFPAVGGALFFTGLAVSLAGVYAEELSGWILDELIATYEDEDAKNEVVCLIYGNIASVQPVYSNWATSANGTLTGNAELIREKVAIALGSEQVFSDLLTMLAPALSIAEYLPGSDGCMDCENWEHVFDYELGVEGWAIVPGTAGTWDAGTEALIAEDQVYETYDRTWLYFRRDFDITYVQEMTLDFDWEEGEVPDEGWFGIILEAGGETVKDQSFGELSDGDGQSSGVVINDSISQVGIYMRCSTGEFGGYARALTVTLKGSGINPFI